MKKIFLFSLIIPFLFACSQEKKMEVKYDQYTLPNGLKVVLHEDHSDPIVGVAIQFHVGSGREKVGKTGFAHFFEHMLFQRSENLPRNAFFQKISAMGGEFNGGTGQDGTVYYDIIPRDALEKVLWMESDRMGFFINTVTQAGLDREVDVILNEKRQTADNRAYGQAFAIMSEEMFPEGHPYSWSVIGKMDDIRSATIDDVKEFYRTFYIPQNATLSIAGDFDPVLVKEMIEKYFGEISKGNDIEKPKPWPITIEKSKNVVYEDPFAPLPLLSVCYPTVEGYHKDEQALSILAELLAGTKNSPLYKTIVEGNLSPNVSAYNNSQEVAGTFEIEVQAFEGVSLDTVYAAIQKGFEMFEQNGIDPKDLEAIKASNETTVYNRLSSVASKALSFARANEFGGKPDRFIDELEDMKKVTAEDVMRVFNQYVKGKNYIALSMVPSGKLNLAITNSVPAKVHVESVEDASSQMTKSKAGAIVDDEYTRTASAFDRSIEPQYMPNTPEVTLPLIWEDKLSNGMSVVGITQNEIPMINFKIVIKGGVQLDPKGKEGVSSLNAALMNQGTELRTPQELEQDLNMLGANVRVFSSKNNTTISGSCLSRNFESTLAIIEEMILKPRFDEAVFEREKNKAAATIIRNKKEPSYIASKASLKLLFGEESVISLDNIGTAESIASITINDIKEFNAKNISPKIASFIVAGDVDKAKCIKALTSIVKNWNGEEITIPAITFAQGDSKGKTYFIDYPGAKQSVVMATRISLPYSDPNYFALDVLNFKLGSGSNGLLFDVLRLQRGYTYGAYSYFSPNKNYGMFSASSSVQANVTKESLDLFKEIFTNYGKNYTPDMLATTKDAMLRKNAFAFETGNDLVNMLSQSYIYDLPKDYVKLEENIVKNITLEQIQSLANEYLDVNGLTFVVVGDAKTQLKKIKGAQVIK